MASTTYLGLESQCPVCLKTLSNKGYLQKHLFKNVKKCTPPQGYTPPPIDYEKQTIDWTGWTGAQGGNLPDNLPFSSTGGTQVTTKPRRGRPPKKLSVSHDAVQTETKTEDKKVNTQETKSVETTSGSSAKIAKRSPVEQKEVTAKIPKRSPVE